MHHYRAFAQFGAVLWPIEAERKRNAWTMASTVDSCNCKKRMEARVGIEPTYKGFADLSLTTWVPRLVVPKFSLTSGNSPSDGKALAGAGLGPEFWSTTRNQFKPIGEAPIPANQFNASGDFGPCCMILHCCSASLQSVSIPACRGVCAYPGRARLQGLAIWSCLGMQRRQTRLMRFS